MGYAFALVLYVVEEIIPVHTDWLLYLARTDAHKY